MTKLATYLTNYAACPVKLQQYVWFIIAYYFARRGRERYLEMTKTTFLVKTVDTGIVFTIILAIIMNII